MGACCGRRPLGQRGYLSSSLSNMGFLQLSARAMLPMTSIEHSHNLYTVREKCRGRCDTFLEDARTTEAILADWLTPKKWGYEDRVSEYTCRVRNNHSDARN